ncbi:baseplate J/gp47 family protein [Brevundimonas sp.]|uniref:baseplate J/gp47 family protein n=1 Tax=Brevundimonas sp. TaxID=1871086 RepID=UPI003D6D8038
MSFARPTLKELIHRGQDDLNARLPGADSRLRRSVLGTIVTVVMGAIYGLYGYLDYLARQILPDTAEAEHLERWAGIFGLTRKAATLSAGQALATGVNGAVIPAGAVLQRADGVTYMVQEAKVVAGGEALLAVAAQSSGAKSQASAGIKLTFVSPIAGVAATAVVPGAGVTGGADQESDTLLRSRLLTRMAAAPAGGAIHDYKNWALEVPEVTRVWPFKNWLGAGTVGVAFVMDGRADLIPTPADVAAVQVHLDAVAPVTADVIPFAPTPNPLNLTISGLTPNDAAVKAAIEAEVEDLLFREAQPGGVILLSHLREAISTAAGERDHVLTSPTANVVAGPGQLTVLGGIAYD